MTGPIDTRIDPTSHYCGAAIGHTLGCSFKVLCGDKHFGQQEQGRYSGRTQKSQEYLDSEWRDQEED
jgi:hypothetical protein